MELFLADPMLYMDGLMLISVRLTGMMLIAPFFGSNQIPFMSRAAFGFLTSIIVSSTMNFVSPVQSTEGVAFVGVMVLELVTGLLMGFGVYIVYSSLSLAGQFIDMQIGFSMVNVFDPLSQIQLTITGNLYFYMLMMITLVTNAHHYYLRAVIDSFYVIPLGGMSPGLDLYDSVIGFMPTFFALALRVAAPVFFVMLVSNVVLGILARTVPQLNMFVVGFPIKIMMGLFTLLIMLTAFAAVSDRLIGESEQLMREIIRGMLPR